MSEENHLNIIEFTGDTYLPVAPKDVLEGAIKNDLDEVFVIGTEKNGELFLASSNANIAFLLKILKEAESDLFARIDLGEV